MLAAKPPETPENAAAIPTSGWRPAAIKIIAPSGITSTYPASAATWLNIATKISIGVSSFFGVTRSIFLSATLIKPELSATPTPSIATSTIPSGANPVKVVTIDDRVLVNASAESRLLTCTACWVTGFTTSNSTSDSTADSPITSSNM
ncbi:hypothetical protein D3C75_647370 [compost metagenome]